MCGEGLLVRGGCVVRVEERGKGRALWGEWADRQVVGVLG